MEDMKCPKCGEDCWRDAVDVGVCLIYGPWGCGNCFWSDDKRYDRSEGPSPAQKEHPDYYVDQFGSMTPVRAIVERCARFGIPSEEVEKAFKVEDDREMGGES